MINDQIIIDIYKDKYIYSWDNIPIEHKEYLKNRFTDSQSIKESVWRILFNIEQRPKCKICGNNVKFIGKKSNIFSKTCSNKCFKKLLTKEKTQEQIYYNSLSKEDKTKYTCQRKYGVDYPAQLNSNNFKIHNPQKNIQIKEKTSITRYEKYGQYMSLNNINSLLSNKSKEKRKQSFNNTMIKKYGCINYRNNNKAKQTCLEKYGVDSYSKTNEYKQKINNQYNIIQTKINNTKQRNNSFNKSKPEDESYVLLKSKYPDILKQYRNELYPFNCDFYIPSLDLYIECNYHWTHGFHPYDPNSIEDKNKLELWKSKSTKFYDNAIKTWTIRDINKRHIAKENKLNWIEFWNLDELKEYLNNK